MDGNSLPELLIGGAFTVLASAVTYFFTIRSERAKAAKTEAETKGANIDNVGKAVGIWEKLVDELVEKSNQLSRELMSFKEENDRLQKKILLLVKENDEMKEEIEKLRDLIKR